MAYQSQEELQKCQEEMVRLVEVEQHLRRIHDWIEKAEIKNQEDKEATKNITWNQGQITGQRSQ